MSDQKFNYEAEALSTASNQFHGEMVSLVLFDNVISRAIEALSDLDAVKKTLFYGKPLPESLDNGVDPATVENCKGLPQWFENESMGELFMHGAIGMATETGELLEVTWEVLFRDKIADKTNAKEEVGDAFWYGALLAKACGFTFDEAMRTNIAKLRKRYPNKFTEYDALNRNLLEERVILESNDSLGEDQ